MVRLDAVEEEIVMRLASRYAFPPTDRCALGVEEAMPKKVAVGSTERKLAALTALLLAG